MLGRQTWPGAAQGLSSVPAHREGVRGVDCRVVCLGLLVAPQGGGDGSRPRVWRRGTARAGNGARRREVPRDLVQRQYMDGCVHAWMASWMERQKRDCRIQLLIKVLCRMYVCCGGGFFLLSVRDKHC